MSSYFVYVALSAIHTNKNVNRVPVLVNTTGAENNSNKSSLITVACIRSLTPPKRYICISIRTDQKTLIDLLTRLLCTDLGGRQLNGEMNLL